MTTTAPAITSSSATTSSAQRVCTVPAARSTRSSAMALLGDEACFLHQGLVNGFCVLHPVGVLLARHERVVERRVFLELLPLRRIAHLLQQIHIEVHRFLRHAGGHEEA